ncbi:endonuclease/exonuclease/phosphatase family protein [Mesonia aestuariivivens]|uniref:Endonuclease/exonuclease/phosphatase family protein n=1 Tax=Mesonia aestuariivivens TaxID=2796128 RepID=A0ABS6W209_9FLAO|nr:endonuclease/exonuclease/phosphatase family protein [Mesonia aestuariivivens]MBW2961169.1 endonuclease/exonuclease/phosphatase family protein [Mesonia aestuariivivens]
MKQQKYKCLHKLIWLCCIALFLLSIIPNLLANYWLADIFSNFKFQYLIASICLLMVVYFLFKKKWLASFVLLLSICWNSYYILPYYLKHKDENIVSEHNLKINSINLLSSNDQVRLVETYLAKENPDVIVLLEFTPKWQSLLKKTIQDYAYSHFVPRNDNFGIAILSKKQLKAKTAYFKLNEKPSIVSELKFAKKTLTLIATHPAAPVDKNAFELRNLQMNYLIENRSNYSDHLIIIGDFNNSSFSNHFQKLLKKDLRDSRLGFGILPTWPANFSLLQTTLDHCLVSKNIQVIERKVGENIGSDHLPISISLKF